MYRRPYREAAAVTVLALLAAGCVQATRHSNTMYFGTNTTFGIKAGASTGETPEVVVGYDRQEAVIMPLLANTGEHTDATRNRLSPCNVEASIEVEGGQYAVHPCSFVSIKGGNLDSYSVLASFGAEFAAQAVDPTVSGGLAQYFATGMAAQILSDRGGAALVSTSAAAKTTGTPPVGTAALFPQTTPFAVGSGKAFDNKLIELRANIREAGQVETIGTKMQGLLDNLKPAPPKSLVDAVMTGCRTSEDDCIAAVNKEAPALMALDNFNESVAAWNDY